MANREIWKPIPGYEGRYWISDLGRIKSKKKILKQRQRQGRRPYNDITLIDDNGKRSTYDIHRLVAMVFLGPKPSEDYQIDHKDGDARNNKASNLEYVTRRENYMRMAANQGRGALVERLEQLEKRVEELEAKLGGRDE